MFKLKYLIPFFIGMILMIKENKDGTDELWGLGVPVYHLVVSVPIIVCLFLFFMTM